MVLLFVFVGWLIGISLVLLLCLLISRDRMLRFAGLLLLKLIGYFF